MNDRSPASSCNSAVVRGLMLLTFALLSSCASGPAGTGQQRTDGLRLEVFAERAGNSYSRYLLTEDGQLHFGGGFDALHEKYTWSGAMTEEDIRQLREILVAQDWFVRTPTGTGRPPPRYQIELERPGLERSVEVEGRSQIVESLIEVLETAARRRHEDILRSLPQPAGVGPDEGE